MRVLITGAGGFVGRHLRTHLESMGDEVIATDRLTGGPDLLDPDGMQALLLAACPEAVYHLAGQADIGGSWSRPVETFRANAEGTLILLEACRVAEVRRVLAVSSADVYGNVDSAALPITESQPLCPTTPYGASKAAAEMVCIQEGQARGLDVIRARAFNHLGPGQSTRFVAAALAQRILTTRGDPVPVVPVGNLSARRDFTDVRDVVRAYRLLVDSGQAGLAYNICTGTDRSIDELAHLMLEAAGSVARLEVDPALYRPVDIPRLVGDPTLITATTGWAPLFPIEQTIADLLSSVAAGAPR